jgi:hypothetical protein
MRQDAPGVSRMSCKPSSGLSTQSVVASALAVGLSAAATVALATFVAGQPVRGSRMCE